MKTVLKDHIKSAIRNKYKKMIKLKLKPNK